MANKQPKMPVPTESVEQINLFRWALWQVGAHPELKWLFHIPNGGFRNKATAGRLKAEGVKSGVPDLCLPIPRGGFHGLYVEMKRLRGNTTTQDQDDWLAFLQSQGYFTAVCRGWEAATTVILDYLNLPTADKQGFAPMFPTTEKDFGAVKCHTGQKREE